jgi:uncharacterized protein with PIN domain
MNKTKEIKQLQDEIKSDKEMINYSDDALKYVQKPIGKAIHEGKIKSNKNIKASDYVECQTCGKKYTKWNSGHHKKTQYHLMYEKVNKKMIKLVLDK